jgi:hypothetical protein
MLGNHCKSYLSFSSQALSGCSLKHRPCIHRQLFAIYTTLISNLPDTQFVGRFAERFSLMISLLIFITASTMPRTRQI